MLKKIAIAIMFLVFLSIFSISAPAAPPPICPIYVKINGTITDSYSTKIPGATVTIYPPPASSGMGFIGDPTNTSDSNGVYKLYNLTIFPHAFPISAEFNITATKPGYYPGSKNITITVDSPSECLTTKYFYDEDRQLVGGEDLEPPQWFDNSTSPSSPTPYSPNGIYGFSINWTDNVAVDEVILRFDGVDYSYKKGEITRITGDAVSGIYFKSFTSLPVDDYDYQWLANDTSDNWNQTPIWTYEIVQANSSDPDPSESLIHLALNGTEADLTIIYGEVSNATGWKDFAEGSLELYRNGTLVSSGQLTREIKVLAAGLYNYTLYYAETENYTEGFVTRWLNVTKKDPYDPDPNASLIHLALNDTEADLIITYPEASNATGWVTEGDVGAIKKLYRNGTEVASGSPATEIDTFDVGIYVYNYTYEESENYTSAWVSRILNVTPYTTTIHLALNGTEADKTYYYPEVSNATGWKDFAEGTLILYRNGTEVDSGQVPNEITTLPVGVHNYTLVLEGAINYIAAPVTRIANVTKRDPSDPLDPLIHLALNGTEADLTINYGEVSNATGWKDFSEGTLELYRNDTLIDSGQTPDEIASLAAGVYNYTLYYPETENYTAGSITRWLNVNKTNPFDPDPSESLIHLALNGTESNLWIEFGEASNATGWKDFPEGSLNLYRDTVLIDSGQTPNELATLPIGNYNYTLEYPETQNYTYAAVTRWLYVTACLSHLLNSTVDLVYYLDEYTNIDNGLSFIFCSNVTNATVTNSTIINSTAIGKDFIGSTLINSWVDPSKIENSTITGGSNVTESNVTFSNISNKSNVSYSEIHYSDINHSNISYSTVNHSDVFDSHIHNSTILNMTVGSANITNCYMYSGWLVYNGTNYSAPPVIYVCGLYLGPDVEAPEINSVEIDPFFAGATANITVNATDNIGVANVTANDTLLTYLTGDLWRGEIIIPSEDGIYPVPIVAMDYDGNQGTLIAYIIINLSADPNATLDLKYPVVGPIWPDTAIVNVNTVFYADVSDDVAVKNCTLYIDGADVGLMDGGLPSNETTVSKSWTFESTGTYKLHAGCYDVVGRFVNGTDVDVVVSTHEEDGAWIPGPGGGNIGPTPGMIGLNLTVPENVSTPQGSTKIITATVNNTGNTSISDIVLHVSGIPNTWYAITPATINLPIGVLDNFTVTITIPTNEPAGTKTILFTASGTDVGEGLDVSASDSTILTIESGPEACAFCPGPTAWTGCVNGTQNRTVYTCDAESNYQCVETAETRNCGDITGWFFGNPAVGAGIIILIVAGALVYLYYRRRSTFDKLMKTLKLDSLRGKPASEKEVESSETDKETKPEPEAEKAETKPEAESKTDEDKTSFDFSVDYND